MKMFLVPDVQNNRMATPPFVQAEARLEFLHRRQLEPLHSFLTMSSLETGISVLG